jgi:hypothetical protein
MIQQILDSELNGRVKKDDELKLKIAKANNVKVDTVTRWLREDDVMLTTATNLSIIRTHFSLPVKQVMTQDKQTATAK